METFFKGFFPSNNSEKTDLKAQALYQLRCGLVHAYEFTRTRNNENGEPPDSFKLALTEDREVCDSIKVIENGPSNYQSIVNINWLYEKVKEKSKGYSASGTFCVYQLPKTENLDCCQSSDFCSLTGDF